MLVKVYEDDNIIVDYDKDNKRYRVSIFEDHHFQDEFWFNAYDNEEIRKDKSLQEIINKFCELPLVNSVSPEELRMAMKISKENAFNIFNEQ